MDYANAVPANNVAGRQAALQRLDSFRKSLDQVFGVSGSASIGDRFISQTTYVTSALDALGAHDLGTAKAFFGGASQQSEEIGARLARATTPTPAVAGL